MNKKKFRATSKEITKFIEQNEHKLDPVLMKLKEDIDLISLDVLGIAAASEKILDIENDRSSREVLDNLINAYDLIQYAVKQF